MQTQSSGERYHRQVILKGFGEVAQQKLASSSVLVIGVGGLGCPLLSYLVAAGVGRIGMIDNDIVMLNNLHRQPLFTTEDIGQKKVSAALRTLKKLNPEINIEGYDMRLTELNCFEYFDAYDIIADCSDNFPTRYLVNDAAVIADKPVIFGAVSQYDGQVAIFNFPDPVSGQAVNYRDLFPKPPVAGEILNCEEAGVLGVLPGIIGTMMAAETIKLIAGIGEPAINKLITTNVLLNQSLELQLTARNETRSLIPSDRKDFAKLKYENICGVPEFDISVEGFEEMIHADNVTVIDVREFDELPVLEGIQCKRIPLKSLNTVFKELNSARIIFVCQSGIRSRQAAAMLSSYRNSPMGIYSLKGGVNHFIESRKTMHHA